MIHHKKTKVPTLRSRVQDVIESQQTDIESLKKSNDLLKEQLKKFLSEIEEKNLVIETFAEIIIDLETEKNQQKRVSFKFSLN